MGRPGPDQRSGGCKESAMSPTPVLSALAALALWPTPPPTVDLSTIDRRIAREPANRPLRRLVDHAAERGTAGPGARPDVRGRCQRRHAGAGQGHVRRLAVLHHPELQGRPRCRGDLPAPRGGPGTVARAGVDG